MPHILELRNDFSSLLEKAELIGTRFAKRYESHLDETIAEALCQLVFYFHSPVYLEMGYDERTLYAWIRFRLRDYFNRRPDRSHRNHLNELSQTHEDGNDVHVGMKLIIDNNHYSVQDIEWIGDFLGNDDEAFKVLDLLKRGLEIADIKLIPDITKRGIDKVRKLLKSYLKGLLNERADNSGTGQSEDNDNGRERAY